MIRPISAAILALGLAGAALADISGNATVNAGSSFNFDKGANGSGDITFTGSSITFTGTAKGAAFPGGGGTTVYNTLTQQVLQQLASFGSSSPIATSGLTAGTSNGSVIALQTNGGNLAKLLVTALSSSSISFQYTTYGVSGGGGGGGGAPTVKDVQNNSSLIPDGFPNSGVSPSTLIVIHGSNMADPNAQAVLQDSQKAGGIPTTLNGASAKITAGGKDYPIGLYYAIASQIAGVVPAAVPTGQATLTVTYNGQSATSNVNIVQSAFGIDVYGANQAVVQDSVTGALVDFTHSAKPGQIVTVWGSGLGSDSADSDVSYTTTPHTISTPVQAYLGGVQVTDIKYSGASVYPGVHIVVFTVPQGVPNGCFDPLFIVTGNNVISNGPIVPVMNNGGVCIEPLTGQDGSQITTISQQTNVRSGSVIVGQATSPATNGGGTQTNDIAVAGFTKVTSTSYGSGYASIGTCSVNENFTGGGSATSVGLDAGTVTVTGPSGGPVTLMSIPQIAGEYIAQLPSGAIPASGGTFTFNGTGGSGTNSVGPFNASVVFPNPILVWTNQSANATVTRSAGQTYTWTGGASGTYVIMSGSSSANGVTGSYTCIAPVEAQQFTVPTFILYGLPAGNGSASVENSTKYTTFTATGLDSGIAIGFTSTMINAVYN